MANIEYSEAIVELLEILEYSDDKILEKIPKKLIKFWKRNKSKTYKPNLDHDKSISEMNLKDKTKSILSMIYLNYLCNDEESKKIKSIINHNEEIYQTELVKNYNSQYLEKEQNIANVINKNTKSTSIIIIENKESIFKKIINRIKRFFNIK
jgi:hypothetical protein